MKMNLKTISISVLILLLDISVYIFLGLLLMSYDDFYDESKGEYWSWASMNTAEQLTVVGLNFWHLINIIVVSYIIYPTFKLIKSRLCWCFYHQTRVTNHNKTQRRCMSYW